MGTPHTLNPTSYDLLRTRQRRLLGCLLRWWPESAERPRRGKWCWVRMEGMQTGRGECGGGASLPPVTRPKSYSPNQNLRRIPASDHVTSDKTGVAGSGAVSLCLLQVPKPFKPQTLQPERIPQENQANFDKARVLRSNTFFQTVSPLQGAGGDCERYVQGGSPFSFRRAGARHTTC